jgi:NADPH:quinone reductase-like Zn-dependent oxidoreductase
MRAIIVRDPAAGVGGLSLTDLPHPHAAENDVIVRVHAAGFTPGELDWPATWTDRAGRDRTPSVPGHELSGVVAGLGYGTTGLSVGQRVFGITDWARDGSLAEYTAVEARNLAPLAADIDHPVAAALPISGLTAWQALFDHGRLTTGQTVLIHGAAGGVGSIAVQLAREVGARVIGTGRAADRDVALGLGTDAFVDLDAETLEDVGQVDVVLDVIGGEILDRSTALVRPGGTLVTIAAPPRVQPEDGRAVFFVVEPDRARLADLAARVRDGRLTPIVGAVRPLEEAAAAFAPGRRTSGKTSIQVVGDDSPAPPRSRRAPRPGSRGSADPPEGVDRRRGRRDDRGAHRPGGHGVRDRRRARAVPRRVGGARRRVGGALRGRRRRARRTRGPGAPRPRARAGPPPPALTGAAGAGLRGGVRGGALVVDGAVLAGDQAALRERHHQHRDQLVHDDGVVVAGLLHLRAEPVPHLGDAGRVDDDVDSLAQLGDVHRVAERRAAVGPGERQSGGVRVEVGHADHVDEVGGEELAEQWRAGLTGTDDADADHVHGIPRSSAPRWARGALSPAPSVTAREA